MKNAILSLMFAALCFVPSVSFAQPFPNQVILHHGWADVTRYSQGLPHSTPWTFTEVIAEARETAIDEMTFLVAYARTQAMLDGIDGIEIYGNLWAATFFSTPDPIDAWAEYWYTARTEYFVMISAGVGDATGDANQDGYFGFLDIAPFITALTDPTGWTDVHGQNAHVTLDMNGDGTCDFLDINPFIDLLSL